MLFVSTKIKLVFIVTKRQSVVLPNQSLKRDVATAHAPSLQMLSCQITTYDMKTHF